MDREAVAEGLGFDQTPGPNHHWRVDVSYINIVRSRTEQAHSTLKGTQPPTNRNRTNLLALTPFSIKD